MSISPTSIFTDSAADAAKTIPPIAVSSFALFGVPLQEWVYIVTITYTLWQFGLSIRRFLRDRKRDK